MIDADYSYRIKPIGLEILEYYTPMQIPPAEKKATLSRDLCGKCRVAFEQFLAEKPVWGKPPVEIAPIVGKEQTPDPFTPVEHRATSRVPNWQKGIPEPKESS